MPSSISPTRHVLIATPVAEREFAELRAWVRAECAHRVGVELECLRTVELPRRIVTSPPPVLAVVCQSTPDEFTAREVEFWLGVWPITRFVCCYGPWSDSDGRTRSAWPLPLRTPVAGAMSRLRQELDVISGTRPAPAATATREEAFGWEYTGHAAGDEAALQTPTGLDVRFETADREYAAMLTDVCADVADGVRAASGAAPYRVVLWDADPWPRRRATSATRVAAELRRRHGTDDIVALLGFPRAEDVEGLRSAGVAAVLPKLTPAATLLTCLRSLSRTAARG